MAGSADSSSAPDGIPAIRTFQFDSTAVGQLASAVNLFRGDVNIPQTLFSLPGGGAGGGGGGTMDVDLTILYQSNVFRDATTWNRDAPTGVLGLGWSLPSTYIQATGSGSPDPDTRSYVLFDNGSPNGLVRQPQQHFLFAMPSAAAAGFQSGQAVPAAARAEFLQNGLPLDAGATVGGVEGAWTVDDDVLQQTFSIDDPGTGSGELTVSYGGQAFQLQSYRFWQIAYFPTYERWLIVTDDGIRKSFGGAGPITQQGYQTATGNSIAWEVWWAGQEGTPVWTGPSSVTSGQVQVARAWYLASTSNRFGDTITYGYNGWERGGEGLLPDVEQQVGAGGLPYTKSVYLTQVTDVFGRTATLSYGDKVWNQAGPREYSDPHRDVPGNDPNAYQDLYDTKYLADIAVSAASGAPLFTVQFDYQPTPSASGPEQALANVTSFTGSLYDDTFKRYLTGVTLVNAAGDALPGYSYQYCLTPSAEDSQPGALQTVTAPQGGTVTYGYTQQQLSVCDRSQGIAQPSQSQTPAGSPLVFYGDDYVVSLWCDANGTVTLQVFTWAGRWICWQLDSGPVLYTGNGIGTVDVLANSEFFVVYLEPKPGTSSAWVFAKDAAQPGQFVPASIDDSTTGQDDPTLTFSATGMVTYSYVGGDSFFAVAAVNANTGSTTYQVLTWRWSTQSWEQTSATPSAFTWLAASGEYLFALDANGDVNLSYLDGTLTWQTSPTATIAGFSVPSRNVDNVVVAAAPGMAVVNTLNVGAPGTRRYGLSIVQWDANHVLQPVTTQTISEPQPTSGQYLGWAPEVVANSLVAVNGTLLRFTGASWLTNSSMVVQNPPVGTTQRYAYGPDYALQVATSPTTQAGTSAAILGFDPDADATSWATTPATPNVPRQPLSSNDIWPASGGADYAVLGACVYFRGTATDWTQVAAEPATNISNPTSPIVSESLVNNGPAFLSYCLNQPQGATVESIVLQNGQCGSPESFPGQRTYMPSLDGAEGAGMSPQGPATFVSIVTTKTLSQATEIYLNRYAADDVTGPLVHYPVVGVTVDDQYQDAATTSYAPDPSQAACDPTGLVVKYYQSSVYPGSADPIQPNYGWTTSTFLNGQDTAPDYYDMLDGLLASTEVFDDAGNALESHESTWAVTQQVASDPVDPSAPPIQLRGGWIMRTEQTSTVDGVTRTKATTFAAPGLQLPYSGRPATTSSASYDGSGNPQTFAQAVTYGPEVDTAMRALNIRSTVVQTTTTQQGEGDDVVVVRSSASSYAPWASAAGEDVVVPAREATFNLLGPPDTAFPFASYAPGTSPDGWLLDRRVTARTARGQVAESEDGCGTASSVIFSADLVFPVASASNATQGTAAYLGFESYEDASGWTLTATQPCVSDARTGTTSLLLPGAATASLSTTITEAALDRVVGFWYKTAPGFTQEPTAGCTITAGGTETTTAFAPTDDAWALQTISVPAAEGAVGPVEVTLANPTATDVLVDSVFVASLAGGMTMRTFDQDTLQHTSASDAAGRSRWSYYDAFLRPTLQAGPNLQPKELAQRYLSRQGSASGLFDPGSPNAELTLHPADGGTVETFVDGGAWQQTWLPSDPAAWEASGGALSHVGTGTDNLAYQGVLPPTWAVYFEVGVGSQAPDLSVTAGPITVSFADGAYTGWDGVEPLVAPTDMARHWLLVAGDGLALFFGDGQLLFSVATSEAAGPPEISTSADLTLSHLSFLASPRLSLSYKDGSSRQRQVHQLCGGDSRVSEVVFDPLDRRVATTRVAPGSFGSGGAQPVLQYRPGFVDVGAFLSSLSTSWVMTGDVADYYQGQVVDGIQRSNDQGYPYRGTRWEASPRRRKVETGLPGLPYAIHDVDSTTPLERVTTQFAFGANAANDGTGPVLPAGDYAQTTVTTPAKTAALRINDKVGQSVASLQQDAGGDTVAQSSGLRSYAQATTGPQATLDLQLPNALTPGPQSGDASYVVTTATDATGRALVATDPDTGQTQFLYDPCGRARFVQPALGSDDPSFFFYTRYDAIGRVVEQGTIDQAWNPGVLSPLAAQPDWPTDEVARTVSLTLSYDGDGDDPTQIGQKIACVTTTPAPPDGVPCVVTETFTYDPSGQVTGAGLAISGPAPSTGAVGYSYNNLGELTTITLPAGSPIAQVVYTMDDQGRIAAIGSSADSAADVAAYTYSADGEVETETLGDGAWVRTVGYSSPGWVEQVAATSADGDQSLTLSYTYNGDSTVASREITYAFTDQSADLADTYTYDAQGRLAGAAGSSDDQITSFDPNGNILGVTQGGNQQSFVQLPGSDQLQQANLNGSSGPVSYDARGRLTSSFGRTLSYDDATNLTVAGSMGSDQVQFGYGSRRQRVLSR